VVGVVCFLVFYLCVYDVCLNMCVCYLYVCVVCLW